MDGEAQSAASHISEMNAPLEHAQDEAMPLVEWALSPTGHCWPKVEYVSVIASIIWMVSALWPETLWCNLTLLHLERTTGLSGRRGTGPPTEPGFFQGFFSIMSPWSFGSLPLSPLACLVGDTSFPAISSSSLHRYYLNWTELDDAITKFNNEIPSAENWVLNLVILHYWQFSYFDIVQLLCYNLYC